MKHYLLQTANGLHTPPCNNSHGKSSHFFNFRFSLFTTLLLLFLLIVGNSPAWADCSFAQGKTVYFDLRKAAWYNDGAQLYAEFFTGNTSLGDIKLIETSTPHVYSVSILNRNDVNKIVINRYSPDGGGHQWKWGYTIDMTASNAGANDCIYMPSWTGDPVKCNWTTFGSGSITTGCGGADTPHTGDKFYIMGSHNGWSKNSEDHKMTVVDGKYAYKTYENITENWDFKVAKEDGTELGWSYFSQSKSDYTCSEVAAAISNIRPDTYNGAKNLTIYWDGVNVYVKVEDATPAVKYTVTLHPNNGGGDIVRENVPEGSNSSATELNLSAVTYGKGTATWYTDAACTTPFTTVTGNMHLYAKWGVSGNYYFVSSLQTASDAGETGNWNSGWAKQLNYTSGNPGKCSYSFIAPAGRFPFELLTSTSGWNSIGDDNNLINNDASNVTVAVSAKHFYFELPEPKKVTISYDGKVSVNVEDYNFDNTKTWHIKTSWASSGGGDWNYNTVLTNSADGGSVTLPVQAGDRSFIISTKTNDPDAQQVVGTETFNALYVDTSNPSSGFRWRMTGAKLEGSGEFNKQLPQADGNYWRNCAFHVDANCDIRITFDGGKIRCDIVAPNIVTFKDGENTLSTQEVSSGNKATKPADPTKVGYTFVKWQSNGSDYDFSSAVTGNITLNAVWAYKRIESVSLNESEHITWVGNSDFTLTPTCSPSDVITKSVTWSSNNESVATVNNGIVHAVGAGTATITCTVTDQYDTKKTATCEVTVAACEMSTSDLYTMTVTSYNTYSGDEVILKNLWNESTENDEPASMTICNIRIGNNGGSNEYYAYDNNGNVMIEQRSDNDIDKWYMINAGTNLYYLKNVSTGKYMYCGPTNTDGSKGNGWTSNGDWFLRSVYTSTSNGETDNYKFYKAKDAWDNDIIVSRADASMGAKVAATDFVLSRQQLTGTPNVWSNVVNNTVSASRGATQGGNSYKGFQSAFVNMENIPNPNYLASQMNGSYYRMKENATVQAKLTAPLVKGAVITVRLYADAATSVQLAKDDGTTVIETINLTADTEFEYSYTVNNASPLLGESVFIIKAADNHAGIASIKVTHTYVANPSDPELSWETDLNGGVTQSALGSKFQHVASSTLSLGAIHYASSNEAVATVAADGTVTPHSAGYTTITATITAEGCYDEETISYNIELTEASLQEAIDATPVGNTLTLTHDYNENAVINKAITLDANGHTIGDLTVEYAGDLTLSSELIVRDFTICAKAGNTSTPAASGQVRNASKLNVNGNAYFLYTVDPSGEVQYGWYDFTVPFPINIVSGIKGIQDGVLKEGFRNGVDYAVMEYFGEKQAQGQYPYKKFSGVMQPNRLYTITLDDSYNYNTLRMQKTADGALVASESVTLNEYAGGDATNANWNGVGNGTLHHADAGISGNYIQVYQSGNRTFLTVNKADYSLVVGSAFMVQQAGGTMTLNQATHGALLAPSRYQSTPATAIQIASEGKPFSDQLFITASETGGQAYTPSVDVAKAGELGSANVPQIWTNAYNSSLCVHEAQLINGKAQYKLSIYAPVAGTYTLTSKNIPADYSLYLTQNSMIVSELSDTYTLDLSKGITTEYGLLLTEIYNSPTAIENTQTDKIQTTKIIRNGVLYILHNGKVYNAQGAKVK